MQNFGNKLYAKFGKKIEKHLLALTWISLVKEMQHIIF